MLFGSISYISVLSIISAKNSKYNNSIIVYNIIQFTGKLCPSSIESFKIVFQNRKDTSLKNMLKPSLHAHG